MIELLENNKIALSVKNGNAFGGSTFRTVINIENIETVIENAKPVLKERKWNKEQGVHYRPETQVSWKATIHKKNYDKKYESSFYTTEESFDDIINAINSQLNRTDIKEPNNDIK